ncbi:hypothetical protein CYLTODRAFT_425792 [Cylindrobasidium torrendii FP15055 ss-10]|uniref:Uncharacterized protein n=1 Tax=Cylindrobasidium torrendii FP15055 ss-10 TaxID=1314674 RepID=A0A0D7B0Q4_9AGAR|nr:hypothetical protein CYLTODRAFT_425792 [Cylindrobasidium torrendii FP15055 ss-10]
MLEVTHATVWYSLALVTECEGSATLVYLIPIHGCAVLGDAEWLHILQARAPSDLNCQPTNEWPIFQACTCWLWFLHVVDVCNILYPLTSKFQPATDYGPLWSRERRNEQRASNVQPQCSLLKCGQCLTFNVQLLR